MPYCSAVGRRLDLKIGFACNNRCRFCVQGDKRTRFAPRPLAELRDLLARARPDADGVVFTGGEPTLRPDLPELVAHARALGYRSIQVQTNGRRLAYPAYLDTLVAAGVTEFSPALHGHTAALHDSLTGAPGAFAQTVAGLRALAARGLHVIANSVITRPNHTHLEELARLLCSLGVAQYQLAFVHPTGTAGAEFDAIVPRMSEVAPFLRAGLAVGARAGVPAYSEAVPECVLGAYADRAAERIIPDTTVIDAELTIADYTRYRRESGKLKGPRCPTCARFAACEGPWREYPERLGWDEFVPVSAA